MFGAVSGSFVTTSAFVIRKSSILSGGPIVTTAFRGLITGGDGPDSPRGVDNYDPAATEGYIIGTSDAVYGRLILRLQIIVRSFVYLINLCRTFGIGRP
jgi:hypothetical protein